VRLLLSGRQMFLLTTFHGKTALTVFCVGIQNSHALFLGPRESIITLPRTPVGSGGGFFFWGGAGPTKAGRRTSNAEGPRGCVTLLLPAVRRAISVGKLKRRHCG